MKTDLTPFKTVETERAIHCDVMHSDGKLRTAWNFSGSAGIVFPGVVVQDEFKYPRRHEESGPLEASTHIRVLLSATQNGVGPYCCWSLRVPIYGSAFSDWHVLCEGIESADISSAPYIQAWLYDSSVIIRSSISLPPQLLQASNLYLRLGASLEVKGNKPLEIWATVHPDGDTPDIRSPLSGMTVLS